MSETWVIFVSILVSDRSWALQLAKPVLQFDALVQHLGQLENTEMQEWKQEQKQEGMPKT